DNDFNYNRYVQTLNGDHGDTTDIRDGDVVRKLDFTDNNNNGLYDAGDVINQEPFVSNVVVNAYRVWNGTAEATPVATFLTGADGNYYFDLNVWGDLAQTTNPTSPHFGQTLEYQISIQDPEGRQILDDLDTFAQTTSDPNYKYQKHYQTSWRINPNWFFAADHDVADINNPGLLGDNPGEIFFDPTGANLAANLLD